MDANHLQPTIEKAVDNKHEEANKLKLQGKDQSQPSVSAKQSISPPAAAAASPASPPSASSSPSHEFSFTISLHSSSTTTSTPTDKPTKPPPSFAIDLSPADDIFFHGHLLPLHLLSHLPVSPRSSTNSMDSFTLPIRDLLDNQTQPSRESNNSSANNNNKKLCDDVHSSDQTRQGRSKFKSFSLFGFTRWRKGCDEVREREENKEKQKKKMRFDVSHVVKRYMRMVQPLLFFKGRRSENIQLRRQPYSFSGNLALKNKPDLRGRRGEFSAPASMRTSPSNSGLLLATATLPSSASDSTMEELQAAIQAAIAHCKNSIATEEKVLKC
ncbi:hypothetical protein FNV43_RR11854 [Rhamnella rubrinervis]|uniref:BRI1 kinase inhibitor 1 n=1 Tax=Rhamnella rubrinervis TaxID=2594499 RepID=A0A8K0MHP6_9ROSA|nr:hypothetical protein FNV43_RR11854 [Rhamnella rubrinervis]